MTAMENDELMRIRGEQVTLEGEAKIVCGQIEDERRAIQGFLNCIQAPNRGLNPDWLNIEIARLRRIDELHRRQAEISSKVEQLKKVSGI